MYTKILAYVRDHVWRFYGNCQTLWYLTVQMEIIKFVNYQGIAVQFKIFQLNYSMDMRMINDICSLLFR